MLFGKPSSGKTCLLDLFVSLFDKVDSWQLDGDMPARWVGPMLVRSQLLYFRDANSKSVTMPTSELLLCAGNEEFVCEYKHQNGATVLSAPRARLFRVCNDGWEMERTLHAAIRRAFCMYFPKSMPEDPNVKRGLMAEQHKIVVACLRAFFSDPPLTDWKTKAWHRLDAMRGIFTAESRTAQHFIVHWIDKGKMIWGGSILLSTFESHMATFACSGEAVLVDANYRLYPINRLGWTKDNNPFGVYVDQTHVHGVSLV